MLRHRGLRLQNLTSLTNQAQAAEDLRKWGSGRQHGIPQKSRLEATRISTIHETKHLSIAGRNRCNGFNSNQYCIISKENKRAVLVDMSDDWADDWHIFLEASGVEVHCIFFTHLHVDNLIGLAPFLHLRPGTAVAWNYAEKYWGDRYRLSCLRYGRTDVADAWLPFAQPAITADTPGYQHILLSSDSNRNNPTFFLSPNVPVCHVFAPGHSMGHTLLHLPVDRLLFTGDLIGNEWIGRVDLPQASGRLHAQSLRMLEDFTDQTVLLPAHGRMTMLGRERKTNRGLRRVYELLDAGASDPCVGFNRGYL